MNNDAAMPNKLQNDINIHRIVLLQEYVTLLILIILHMAVGRTESISAKCLVIHCVSNEGVQNNLKNCGQAATEFSGLGLIKLYFGHSHPREIIIPAQGDTAPEL